MVEPKHKYLQLTMLSLLLLHGILWAQTPNYHRFTTKDGLPTNYVYGVLEDDAGTIWAYTVNGLAKFDGYSFQHFSTADGLPGNDIPWALKADDGKIWLYTYQNRPAYLWRDSVYIMHKEQAKLLGLSHAGHPVYTIADHNYTFANHWKKSSNRVFNPEELERFGQQWEFVRDTTLDGANKVIDLPLKAEEVAVAQGEQVAIWNAKDAWLIRRPRSTKDFLYSQNNTLYWQEEGHWYSRSMGQRINLFRPIPYQKNYWLLQASIFGSHFALLDINQKRLHAFNTKELGLKNPHHTIARLQDTTFWIVSDVGSVQLDYEGHVLDKIFWTDQEHNWYPLSTYTDREGNIWQGTRSGGLLMIPFTHLRSRQLSVQTTATSSFERLLRTDAQQVLGITSAGQVLDIRPDTAITLFQPTQNSRFRAAEWVAGGLLLSLDQGLFLISYTEGKSKVEWAIEEYYHPRETDNRSESTITSPLYNLTSLVETENGDRLQVVSAVSQIIYSWDVNHPRIGPGQFFQLSDRVRMLYAHPYSGTLYGGDLEGLSVFTNDRKRPFLRACDELKDISALFGTPDKLWIGTESNGLFCYHLKEQTLEQVAAVNYVHAIRADDDRGVLVACNEGVLVISDDQPTRFQVFDTSDGLPTNKVEDVLALGDSLIWVASSYGLHQLDRRFTISSPLVKDALQITTVQANNHSISPLNQLEQLSYTTKQLRFEFHLRSYASRGDITYQTYLEPLEQEWSSSPERSRQYFGLSPGDYTFHLRAIDAYGRTLVYTPTRIHIETAFWQEAWFRILLVLSLMAGAASYGIFRFRKTQLELQQEKALNKRLAEMEMQALKAQMNPHFIFNALGSIQYFIQTQEVDLADDYLTRFAKLMRLYLDSARETLLPLKQEISLLKNYTELEQMRFEGLFQTKIEVSEDLAVSTHRVPAMIIQPFVENAINHGLSERRDGQGELVIRFEQPTEGTISCTIVDNGIGRQQSAQRPRAGHRSRGMQIVQEKIDTLGAADLMTVHYEIRDAIPDHPTYPGTLVNILFKPIDDAED